MFISAEQALIDPVPLGYAGFDGFDSFRVCLFVCSALSLRMRDRVEQHKQLSVAPSGDTTPLFCPVVKCFSFLFK